MKLYIANTTKQANVFHYRMPENPRIYQKDIPAGGQAMIHSPELTQFEVDHIVKQHEIYGLCDASRLDQNKAYVGLCYSVDKPIDADKIAKTLKKNDAVLEREGQEFRKNSAVALNEALNAESDNSVKQLSVEIVEEAKRGQTASHDPEFIDVVNSSERGSRRVSKR